MPVQVSQDSKGCFARWGKRGKKYYYECGNEAALSRARKKALAQGVAIGEFFERAFKLQASYSDYPDVVKRNAQRGIELNEKQGNRCATQVGKVRAQQLAKGEPVSVNTIKRMFSYLSRAEIYYDQGTPEDCGYISYLLWGGKAAKDWAESKIKEIEKES